MVVHEKHAEPWMVTLVDTGDNSMTGGRLGRVANYIKNEDFFCMTYGDGLSNVDITNTIKFHQKHGKQGIIEAMKTMNNIASDKDGIVKKILVENEQPIQFDDPLILIAPKCS